MHAMPRPEASTIGAAAIRGCVAAFIQGSPALAFAAPQKGSGVDAGGDALVPSPGKKPLRKAEKKRKRKDLLTSSKPPAKAVGLSLDDWFNISRQGARYYVQGVRLLAERRALDLQRVAMTM